MSTVVVTGCNRGIGLSLCEQLTHRGDDVIGVCRRASSELIKLGIQIIENVDVSVDADAQSLARKLQDVSIDILINNAGILQSDTFETIDYDSMLRQFRVNTIGPLNITRSLLPNLGKGSKVAIVSSRVGSIGDNSSGNNYGYRVSKAGANMVGMNLSHDLAPRGIAVALLHPGLVATEMTGGTGVSPSHSSKGLIERIDALTLEESGGFWHAQGERDPTEGAATAPGQDARRCKAYAEADVRYQRRQHRDVLAVADRAAIERKGVLVDRCELRAQQVTRCVGLGQREQRHDERAEAEQYGSESCPQRAVFQSGVREGFFRRPRASSPQEP